MKEDSYNPAAIEKEVQAYWKKNKSFEFSTKIFEELNDLTYKSKVRRVK